MEIVEREVNQPWYKSRRLQGSALTFAVAVAIFFVPEQYDLIVQSALLISMGLGIRSWQVPVK